MPGAAVNDVAQRLFPEVGVGGFTRVDGTVQFYARINSLLQPHHIVVDFGAGRGSELQNSASPFRTGLRKLQGKCAKLIGVDVDEAVLKNPFIDEAVVIEPYGKLPFEDASVDVVVADWVFEHIGSPERTISELHRILKPGGWICARTPNRFGYLGIAANLVPNSLHTAVLKVMQPNRKEEDVFPTTYQLNSFGALKRHFPQSQWDAMTYSWNAEPAYFGKSALLWRCVLLLHRLMPEFFGTTLMVFLQKRDTGL